MRVRVRLIGRFMAKYGFAEKDLEVPAPATAGAVAVCLGMDEPEKVVTREGLSLEPAAELKDGDRLVIAPIFSGG